MKMCVWRKLGDLGKIYIIAIFVEILYIRIFLSLSLSLSLFLSLSELRNENTERFWDYLFMSEIKQSASEKIPQ